MLILNGSPFVTLGSLPHPGLRTRRRPVRPPGPVERTDRRYEQPEPRASTARWAEHLAPVRRRVALGPGGSLEGEPGPRGGRSTGGGRQLGTAENEPDGLVDGLTVGWASRPRRSGSRGD